MKKNQHRKLAAILFADIQGYTAIMQRDETLASTLLKRFQNELIEKVSAHNGRIVNFYGDGALSTFQNPLEAIRCAMEVQSNFQTQPIVPVRIGVHMGTVVFEGDKVYGDSVTVASRIESMGIPGAILVSKKVRDELKNQPDLLMPSLGEFEFKNVQEPIEVFALANEGFAVPQRKELQGKFKSKNTWVSRWLWLGLLGVIVITGLWFIRSQQKSSDTTMVSENSIAVLPFTNMNKDDEGELFCDGMMEDILTYLSKLQNLKVISRTSAMHYKNSTKKLPEIANELGVAHILEGSVRKYGNKARINVQLIRAEDDHHIWAENYDRSLEDIFNIQSEVAQQIVQALQINISPKESNSLEVTKTSNTQAYQLYIRGKRAADDRTRKGLEQSVQQLKAAIALDSTFADAYANLAYTIFLQERRNFVDGPNAIGQILELATKSLQLDGGNVLAYTQLGVIAGTHGNMEEARRIIDKAIEIAPNSPLVYHASAQNYGRTGQRQKEVIDRKKAVDLDPLFWLYQANYVESLTVIGEFEKAEQELNKGKLLFPEAMNYFLTREGELLVYKKQYQKAISIIESTLEFSTRSQGRLGYCYAKIGEEKKAKEWLEKIQNMDKVNFYLDHAIIYAGFQETDSVSHYLNRAADQAILERSETYDGSKFVVLKRDINEEPYFEDFRSEARYQGLLDKLEEVEQVNERSRNVVRQPQNRLTRNKSAWVIT